MRRGTLLPLIFIFGACSALQDGGADSDLGGRDQAAIADLLPGGLVRRGGPLRMPVEDVSTIDPSIIIGVDHNPVPSMQRTDCLSYAGYAFPFCYAGHEGTDFILDGGFAAMDAGSAWIVAAAAGKVIAVEDGHYDHCHASLATGDVSCDGYPMISNHVVIEHADYGGLPMHTEYHHMMKGSIVVTVGMTVSCGQRLGRIGSSGRSSLPHVHLNLLRDGKTVDPYGGPFSQPQTFWQEQQPDPMILPPARCEP